MVDVTTEIEIDRPRADVAAFASDPDKATAWYARIKAVEWKTPKPVGVGSRIAAPFVAIAMRRANRKDLDKLKSLLEAPAVDG